ncbi:transposase [Kutzneria buriramensis]|nr:transposase [Kutzneria buriramensis]
MTGVASATWPAVMPSTAITSRMAVPPTPPRLPDRRADALFELCDAVLCGDGPVRSIAELSLVGEHRGGHGSGYAGLTRGQIDIDRLRAALTNAPVRALGPLSIQA